MTSTDFGEIFELVRWEGIARFMREARWAWASLGSPPTVEDLKANVMGKKAMLDRDPQCMAVTSGGFSVRRCRTDEGETWEILFDIATSHFWPEGWVL